jgi:flagellar biosynthesis/type III secretory pathway protein FliH
MIKSVYRTPLTMPITQSVTIGNTVYIPKAEIAPDLPDSPQVSAEDVSQKAIDEAIEKGITEGLEEALTRIKGKTRDEQDKILGVAKESARQIEEDARAAANTVMETARTDAGSLRAKAIEDGYSQGFETAKAEILDKYNKYIDAAAKLLSDINARKESYFHSNEAELRATVYVIAEKIVRSELTTRPEAVESIIADAAKKYRNSKYLKISMADNEESRKLKVDGSFVRQLIPYIEHIDVELSDEAPEGTIILDDGEEVTDASIPTQLELLKEILKNTRGSK